MNWNAIVKFNFTYAIAGGAWLEDSTGYVNWESFAIIERKLGQRWIDRQLAKQGWMTGCWIDVDNTPAGESEARRIDRENVEAFEVQMQQASGKLFL